MAVVKLGPSNPKSISANLKLNYEDSRGDSSERIVDVKECDTNNPAGYLIGFCHLRNAIRTFRMDRIKKAIDIETGEVITSLTDFAAKKYGESPLFSIEGLLEDSMDAIRGLFYIAKADGRFTAKEKMVFLEYCHAASGDERINLKDIEEVCKYLPIPSMQAFKLICGRLAKLDDARRKSIISFAEKIIATERKISSEEAEAIAYMKKRLDPVT